MNRNKRIVAVANCLLNVNAKVEGIAEIGGAAPLIGKLIEKGYGIIQLPCIEMAMFGTQRWGVVYQQCDFAGFRDKCRELLAPIVGQLLDYDRHGYEIAAIIGMDGSPTCGVNLTVEGSWGGEFNEVNDYLKKIDEIKEAGHMGVMMEELASMLKERRLEIPFYAVDEKAMSSGDDVLKML